MNILIDDVYHARIADFGLVIVGDATDGRMTTARDSGTVQYMAPERFNIEGAVLRQTSAADVYSYGCLCYAVSLIRRAFCPAVG